MQACTAHSQFLSLLLALLLLLLLSLSFSVVQLVGPICTRASTPGRSPRGSRAAAPHGRGPGRPAAPAYALRAGRGTRCCPPRRAPRHRTPRCPWWWSARRASGRPGSAAGTPPDARPSGDLAREAESLGQSSRFKVRREGRCTI